MDWNVCEISGNYFANGSTRSYWIFDNARRFYLSRVSAKMDENPCGNYDTLEQAKAEAERIENIKAEREA